VLASGPGDDGVAVLTLNRPEKKNALSIALREEAVALLGGSRTMRPSKSWSSPGAGAASAQASTCGNSP
jgi:hypothetical protein